MIKYPRLYVKDKFSQIIRAVNVSITLNIIPLSTATITLPKGEGLPSRSYVELFTPYGSAGMFRVRSPHDAYGNENTTAELEHMISEVGDYIVKEEISEMLPADSAMRRIFAHYKGSHWKLGSVSALGTGKIACEAKYERVLDVMLSILEQKPDCMMTFDFSTTPWTVNIVKKGTTVSAQGRLARNVSNATITYDDSELCTRVWYQTFDKDKNATWKSKDANVSKYGVVEGTVRTSADMTADEIVATVDAYLNDHKDPRVSINIRAIELSKITGESLDKIEIGKLYQLALPEYDLTVQDNVTSITWSDVYGNPTAMDVTLGAEEDTVVTFLHNLDSKGAGGGGGGKAKDKEEVQWKEFYTDWEKQDEYIAGLAVHQDRQGRILEEAGLTLDANGLLVYAKTANGLYHQFDVLNNNFTSRITNERRHTETLIEQLEDQINLKVDANGVISAINLAPGSASISADKIDINGIVTKLETRTLGVGGLKVEGTSEFYRYATFEAGLETHTGSNIDCGGVVIADNGFKTGSYTATWRSTTIRDVELSGAQFFLYTNSSSGTTPYGSRAGRIVTSYTDKTIYYLGRG